MRRTWADVAAAMLLALLVNATAKADLKADVNGLNGWTDAWGSGTPNYATCARLTCVEAHSGGGVLKYGHVAGDPGCGVDHLLGTPVTNGEVTITYWLYIPTNVTGSFFMPIYGTDETLADQGIWGAAYIQPGGAWAEQWLPPPANTVAAIASLLRDQWQEIKYVLNLTNATQQYFLNGKAEALESIGALTRFTGFGMPFKESWMGTPFTGGPVYFDDFSMKVDGVEVWRDDFESYGLTCDPAGKAPSLGVHFNNPDATTGGAEVSCDRWYDVVATPAGVNSWGPLTDDECNGAVHVFWGVAGQNSVYNSSEGEFASRAPLCRGAATMSGRSQVWGMTGIEYAQYDVFLYGANGTYTIDAPCSYGGTQSSTDPSIAGYEEGKNYMVWRGVRAAAFTIAGSECPLAALQVVKATARAGLLLLVR